MHQHYAHLFPTPKGITLAGVVVVKRNKDGTFDIEGRERHVHAMIQAAHGRPFSPRIIDGIKRGCKWFAKLSDEELSNAAFPFFPGPHAKAHSANDIPVIAKGLMELALTGCNDMPELVEGKARLVKVQCSPQPDSLMKSYGLPTWDELRKDDGDDSDDNESDDSEDDSDSGSDSGDDNDSGGGNGHYNPDEPRIPAGQPGGGQWTTAGNGTTSDSGSISADNVRSAITDEFNNPSALPQGTDVAANDATATDATPATNTAQTSNVAGTLTHVDNLPLAPNNNALPYFNSSITSQVSGFFNDAQQQGIPIQMTSGFRSTAAQSDLTGNQYGGAAAGSSLHEAGFAFDINWNALTAEQQNQVLTIAQQHNLQWGGNFNTTPDPVHFYVDPFPNVSERRAYIPQAQQQFHTLQR